MLRVKICGITNVEDALLAVEAGADALGFVFASSPRSIEPEAARGLVRALPPFVSKVGVFVNQPLGYVLHVLGYCGLDTVQLHGDEEDEYCQEFREYYKVIKAIRVKDRRDLEGIGNYDVDAYLLDAYTSSARGGTGRTFDWGLAREAKRYGRIVLAGGLTPDNVKEAVELVGPYAVDVSSGVEAYKGKKDPQKLREFIQRAKSCISKNT